MKIYTAVLNQQSLMSLFFPDSLVLLLTPSLSSLPPHQHSEFPHREGVVSLPRATLPLFFPLTPSQPASK